MAPLAYAVSSRSRDAKRAERASTVIDGVVFGAWTGVLSFTLWPTAAAVLIGVSAAISVGGVRLGLASFTALAAAAFAANVLAGAGPTGAAPFVVWPS